MWKRLSDKEAVDAETGQRVKFILGLQFPRMMAVSYCKGENELWLIREPLTGPIDDCPSLIHLNARLTWTPPHESQEITLHERSLIKREIEIAFAVIGKKLVWNDRLPV